jgi:hypothetical protein
MFNCIKIALTAMGHEVVVMPEDILCSLYLPKRYIKILNIKY